MARILLGVSGGIAAYKALELVRLATGSGHAVRVIQTPASRRFVGPDSFVALSGAPVLFFEDEADPLRGAYPGEEPAGELPISHLALAERADLYLIAPATANTIAKLAHGFADNLLTAAALACRAPLLVAPAMNERMYLHPATQQALSQLKARGVQVIAPGRGRLASRGEEGWGRLAEPGELLARCEQALAGGDGHEHERSLAWLRGRRVLVSAGGTREPIDAVRFLGNRSSGRMGYALAGAASRAGAEVMLVSANAQLPAPAGVRVLAVQSAADLEREMIAASPSADLIMMAAAVADFRPREPADGKIKRAGRKRLTIELERTGDILAQLVGARRAGQLIVGFAAEHGEAGILEARRKLKEKGVDAIVYNDIADPTLGFDAEENAVTVLAHEGERRLARAPKPTIAEGILTALHELGATRQLADTSA
ncbi:MAG TPA: bifunctional phosphopantothenoylcysteine decarboxylase/phosphopantothenate--cysteine ligase CoaBC [Solirubrobacteraceae bacterium]|nr:bifunctional phosphopantothenoylcysteine decarboxylase/phosphopantothenate--cysteine ligase CoaBC [Solirubrobacteraceae bacterium]